MAYIAQEEIKLGGRQWPPGSVLPKEIEDDPSQPLHRLLGRGEIICLPDEIVNGEGLELDEADSSESSIPVDLSGTVDEVVKELKDVDNKDTLDEIQRQEALGDDRKTVYQAIANRQNDLI